jgi:HSP20 family protein
MLSPISTDWSWPRRSFSSDRMEDVFEDFDRMVDRLFQPPTADTMHFQPCCDVNETKDHFLVSFDVPGVKKEDIKIEIQGNQLIISGERHYEMKEEKGEEALRRERSYGKFERTFVLPATISADKIEAHYENGVLNVALPKADAAKARTIQIQTDQDGFFRRLLRVKEEDAKELKDVKIS